MKRIVGILILIVVLLSACGGGDVSRRMDLADSLMEEWPDSALCILQSIDSAKIDGKSQYARYALLTTQARVKNDILNLSDTSALPHLDYYRDNGSDFDRMRAAFYKAQIYGLTNNNSERILNLLSAEDFAKEVNDQYWLAKVYEQKARLYNSTGYLQESVNDAYKAIALYHLHSKKLNEAFLYCDIATIYYNFSKYKESEVMLDSIQLLFDKELGESEYLRAYFWDITISNLIAKGNYKKADSVNKHLEALNIIKDSHMLKNDLFLKINGDTTGISTDLKEFKKLCTTEPLLTAYYQISYNYEFLRGNIQGAKAFVDSAIYFHDIAVREALRQSVIATQLDAQIQKSYQLKQKNQWLLYISLSLIIAILISFIYYRLNIIRIQNKKDSTVNEISAQLAKQHLITDGYKKEIASLNQDLGISKVKIKDLEDSNARFSTEYNRLAIPDILVSQSNTLATACLKYIDSIDKNEKNATYDEIQSILRSLISENSLLLQEKQINETYNDILINFKNDFPKIYRDNRELIVFMFTKTKPRLISVILQKPEQTIYTKRKRIIEEIRKSDFSKKDIYLKAFGHNH
ncbi:MAG: hypothetical protein K2G24_02160 [Muribaculaceae bacterium]|nr:hypothetical protein [Muribaculaceae bacterium]